MNYGVTTRGSYRDAAIVSLFMVTAYLVLGLYPLIFADMLAAGRATIPQLSRIATTDFLTVGLVSLAAPRFLSLERVRLKAFCAAMFTIAGNLWSTQLNGDAMILSRLVAGIGSGVLIWLQYAYVARTAKAGALSGIYLAVYVVGAVGVSYFTSSLIVPRFGVNGTFVAMAGIAAVTGVVALFGPKRFESMPVEDRVSGAAASGRALPVPALLVLASAFFMNASSATVWIYFEPITAAANISRSVSDTAAELSLILQAVGALLGASLCGKLHYKRVLIAVGLAAAFQCAYLMFGHITALTFTLVVDSMGLIGYAMIPFEIAMLIDSDPSRRSVDYFSAPVVLGSGIGPLLASIVVSDHDVRGGVALSLLWAILSFGTLIGAMVILANRPPRGDALRVPTEKIAAGQAVEEFHSV